MTKLKNKLSRWQSDLQTKSKKRLQTWGRAREEMTANIKGYIKVEPMVDGISVELPFVHVSDADDRFLADLEFQLTKESADELYNKLGFALQDMDEHIDEYIESVKGLEPPFK